MSLSITARHQYYNDLGRALPLANCFEDHERHHLTAVEAFEALHPADGWEASLAVRAVVAYVHAIECMHEARQHQDDVAKIRRSRAQFASLMRESRAARRMLLQEQKSRRGVEQVAAGVPAAPDAPPAEPSSPQADSTETVPPQALAAKPAAPPQPDSTASSPPEAIEAARAFMQQQPAAAARIRADGGITQKCRARWSAVLPPDPAVIKALVRTPRKLLLAANAASHAPLPAAA